MRCRLRKLMYRVRISLFQCSQTVLLSPQLTEFLRPDKVQAAQAHVPGQDLSIPVLTDCAPESSAPRVPETQ